MCGLTNHSYSLNSSIKNYGNKISIAFRISHFSFDSQASKLYKRVSLAHLHFLLFGHDNNPLNEISHLQLFYIQKTLAIEFTFAN